MMRKRGRENPCFICGHYHKFEEGEVCGICGHKKAEPLDPQSQAAPSIQLSAFPTEIMPDFLFLGSYDNASRSELLKAQGISHILNAVPTCPNLYRNSFNYFSMPESASVPFDDCFEFLEQARTNGARVLVHCMTGQSRSPAVVAAYFMRKEGVSVQEAVSLLKQLRPSVNIPPSMMEQLNQYEAHLRNSGAALPGGTAQAPVLQFSMPPALPSADDVSPSFSTALGTISSPSLQPNTFFTATQRESVIGDPQGSPIPAERPSTCGSDAVAAVSASQQGAHATPSFSFQSPAVQGSSPQGFVFGANQSAPQDPHA